MWLGGILGLATSRLIFQWGNTTKLPWVHTVTWQYPFWYDLRCCKDVKHQHNQHLVWIHFATEPRSGVVLAVPLLFDNLSIKWLTLICTPFPDCILLPVPGGLTCYWSPVENTLCNFEQSGNISDEFSILWLVAVKSRLMFALAAGFVAYPTR